MPNWVRSELNLEIDNTLISNVERIIKDGGICRHYRPMPKELEKHTSPVTIVSLEDYAKQQANENQHIRGITQQMHDTYIEKYGYADWYKWANDHWGTKWGDVDLEMKITNPTTEASNGTSIVRLRWESAWSPIDLNILAMFVSEYITTGGYIDYWWEEEQGYGAQYKWDVHKNNGVGGFHVKCRWDEPIFDNQYYKGSKSGELFNYLLVEHENAWGKWKTGFYGNYSLNKPYDFEVDGLLSLED
jgi:hypothetical protein